MYDKYYIFIQIYPQVLGSLQIKIDIDRGNNLISNGVIRFIIIMVLILLLEL